LRIWEWATRAVVMGAGCRLANDVYGGACARDGVPILRRSSGGGTVLLHQGCLLFTLILAYARAPELRTITSSYRFILGTLIRCLAPACGPLECAGISDLAQNGRKI